MNKYYQVEAKCGHVGRNNYIIITFGIKAESAKEAARIARRIPRVKHHHKDAIMSVKEIDKASYIELKNQNKNDLYLQCHNVQEQNKLNIKDRLFKEEQYQNHYRMKKENIIHKCYVRSVEYRHPKKMFNYLGDISNIKYGRSCL